MKLHNHALFEGGLGVTYSLNEQKAPPWVEARRLSHKRWKSIHWYDLGACMRKKYSTMKRSHKTVTFHPFGGEAPVKPIGTKIFMCVFGRHL